MAPTTSTSKTQPKILRILRLRVTDKPGFLGKVATLLGDQEANIGEIHIHGQGPDFIIRDISLQLDDEKHLQRVQDAVSGLEGVEVEMVIDPVQLVHQGGKIEMRSRIELNSLAELRRIYTPGVAQICKLIAKDKNYSKEYTSISNTVAVVTNGTAILGLGNIGPVAGMPVMEGKSVLFSELVGISAVPILIESTDSDYIIESVKAIAPTFGAIHLEDIAAPECFDIEERLQNALSIPVLHDDQHATAIVVLGALLTITQRMGIDLASCNIGIIGLGAAGAGIAQLLQSFGAKKIFGTDLKQAAMDRLASRGGYPVDLQTVMKESEVVVATTGVPGLIKPEMVKEGQVILALSNPDPEIDPDLAIACGAKFAADGRTINNALSFPGLFKGALMSGATRFTDAMKIAAAQAIAGQTKMDNLVPSILDREVHKVVADAVALAARTGEPG
ncbi:MAG: NAD-dependent malic enzyme [Cyanobacteria bacterium SZAS LIN-5]|nr:NAD-dependent malic enzyme [Cyanobacteria bacterium SZAS LIN-5]RTL37717.1 MAG: NAD-dependent malic enzyme [Candidatus Melainabacteria bacterium]